MARATVARRGGGSSVATPADRTAFDSTPDGSLSCATMLLRVAVIGSGPAAFYAAEHLLKQTAPEFSVNMIERLPTPYGLVRGGVAPDHQKIKSVIAIYEKIAAHPGFRFHGNVEFGRDLTTDDLERHFHAMLYATGSPTDRHLGVPGEDL